MTDTNNNTRYDFLNTIAEIVATESGTRVRGPGLVKARMTEALKSIEKYTFELDAVQLEAKNKLIEYIESEKDWGDKEQGLLGIEKWIYSRDCVRSNARYLKEAYEMTEEREKA